MNRYSYAASLEPALEGGYIVTFRDLSEAITQGETLEDSLIEASDCLAEAIAARIDDGSEIPEPSEMRPGEYRVAVPLHIALKAALYLALKETEVAKVQLGERLGKDEKEIRRILSPHHGTKVSTIEKALRALGKYPELHLH
ncbi:MAG: type II toxin-antitoxin system HicB family antitoxin [Acaryochloridaceae cyanobacterium CSU_3_4]|nr:type II toxin-antitoxin system HicB family antitoxin [Acaryochloris sp. SU_5_25]NJN39549.1 type II toxin-antitoxin system HicB family antitoxin [Acaryochloridaceae cyanobacterium CSU_3_4]